MTAFSISGSPDGLDVNEIAVVLREAREVFAVVQGTFLNQATPDSELEHDAMNELQGPGGLWGREPVDHIGHLAKVYARIAADHLAGLAALYFAGEVFFAPKPLVRAAFEYCTRVAWFLDPKASLRQRCARAALEEWAGACEAHSAVSHLRGDTALLEITKASVKNVKRTIRDLFAAEDVELGGGRRDWRIAGEQSLSPTDAAAAFAVAHGGHVDGQGIYDALSLLTHPQGLAAGVGPEYPKPGEPPGPELVTAPIDALERLTTGALSPWYSTMCLVMSYHGWKSATFDAWERKIDEVFPGLLLEPTE